MSFKRRAMRAEERAKAAAHPNILAETKGATKAAEGFIRNMLDRFQHDYNQYLSTPENYSPASQVQFNFGLTEITASEDELRNSMTGAPEEIFRTALRDETNPAHIKIGYLRVDKITFLKEDHKL